MCRNGSTWRKTYLAASMLCSLIFCFHTFRADPPYAFRYSCNTLSTVGGMVEEDTQNWGGGGVTRHDFTPNPIIMALAWLWKERGACTPGASLLMTYTWQSQHSYHFFYHYLSTFQCYRIAGNFRGRKLSRISKKWPFRRENFCGSNAKTYRKLVWHARISWRKLSRVARKPWNSWMFSPSKFSTTRYT